MNYYLFDHPVIHTQLLPLTYTRAGAEIRVGISTILEKWEAFLELKPSILPISYLEDLYPKVDNTPGVYINATLCPDSALLQKIESMSMGDALYLDKILIVYKGSRDQFDRVLIQSMEGSFEEVQYPDAILIQHPWDIFKLNAQQIRADFNRITSNRKSCEISDPNTVIYGKENLFVEEGVKVKAAIIDAENGPVYLGKNTEIHHGAIIRGALALCEGAQISMGAKFRGDTTVGPYSKIGGEVANSVIFGYSNKAHDGYLGNSVVGTWCNIGADTNSSNMKNDYTNVRLWDYQTERFADSGDMFCGFIMGDHSKLGINVMVNSGTSIGVSCSLYNSNYLRNFIPSFSTGSADGISTLPVKKALQIAEKVVQRRNKELTDAERDNFQKVFELSARFRKQ